MGASKVIVDGETIVDLTGDTATPETVAEGETFHTADGEEAVGTMVTAPVVQTTGDSETSVMSQKVVSEIATGLEDRILSLENKLYTPIAISSLYTSPASFEIGSTVSALTLKWATNKTPTALVLNTSKPSGSVTLTPTDTSKAVTGVSATTDNNVIWTLTATDERDATAEKSVKVTFYNGVYYGAASAPAEYDSAFVLGLSKELRGGKKTSFSATAGEGEYIFYCLPTRMGACSFSVGGFTGGFTLVDTIAFTNASGYTENYYIYKSDNANLGETSVTVK